MFSKYLVAVATALLTVTPASAAPAERATPLSVSNATRAGTATSGKGDFARGGTFILGAFGAAALFISYHVFKGDGERENDAADSN
jgi:hypothetical protein